MGAPKNVLAAVNEEGVGGWGELADGFSTASNGNSGLSEFVVVSKTFVGEAIVGAKLAEVVGVAWMLAIVTRKFYLIAYFSFFNKMC